MQLFIETIRVFEGKLENIAYHNTRLRQTRREKLGRDDDWHLEEIIQIPVHLLESQVYKCRVTYGEQIEKIEFEPYTVRPVESLQLVNAEDLDYAAKYADRTALNLLTQQSQSDDILIVRNGCISDTSYTNIAFFDGNTWFTPSTSLLRGTRRSQLLADGIIQETIIQPVDLLRFKKSKLINAMMTWDESPEPSVIKDQLGEVIWKEKTFH